MAMSSKNHHTSFNHLFKPYLNILMKKLLREHKLYNCGNAIEPLKCPQCSNFETHSLVHLKQHSKAGHTLLKLDQELHDCEKCNFWTYSKCLAQRHKLLKPCIARRGKTVEETEDSKRAEEKEADADESDLSMVQWFKCDKCPFETKYLHSIKDHMIWKHTEPGKIEWFDCAQCCYKSKTKSNLRNHVNNKHNNKDNLKCDHCLFETRFRHILKNHVVSKHTEPERIQWFECAQCPYKSKTKSTLRNHTYYKHDNEIYLRCDRCPYETKFEHSLNNHFLTKHKDRGKIQWFECEHCHFKTRTKQTLQTHFLSKHTDLETIQWFECAHCTYRSKTKSNLNKHYRKHDLSQNSM